MGWRQVPINSSVLGKTADQSRPEIAQVMFKKMRTLQTNDLERDLFETRKKIEKMQEKTNKRLFIYVHSAQDRLFTKECF